MYTRLLQYSQAAYLRILDNIARWTSNGTKLEWHIVTGYDGYNGPCFPANVCCVNGAGGYFDKDKLPCLLSHVQYILKSY